MVGAAVAVGLVLAWLASKRLEFTWRVSWLMGLGAAICAASLNGGTKVATGVAGGIFTLAHGIASFIGHI